MIPRKGILIQPISLAHREPITRREYREWVSVRWDDGTQGHMNFVHLEPDTN